jgi:hypothetical protein
MTEFLFGVILFMGQETKIVDLLYMKFQISIKVCNEKRVDFSNHSHKIHKKGDI